MMRTQLSILVLLALGSATDLALRPLIPPGFPAPDPALIALLWCATLRGRSAIYPGAVILVLARVGWGVSGPLVLLPVLASLELSWLGNRVIQMRDPLRRVPVVVLSLFVGPYLVGGILAHADPLASGRSLAALLSHGLSAIILLPILDAVGPLFLDPDRDPVLD